jgi:mycothiol system anti-sigma-R factor
MNCKEALAKLYDVIDKEASEIDEKEVREHLEHCKDCLSRFEFEKIFKTFVTEKADIESKTDKLRTDILKRCSEIDKAPHHHLKSKFRLGAIMVAAAASLVVCIFASLALADYYRHQTFVVPFESAHMKDPVFAGHNESSVDQIMDVRKYLNDDLRLSIDQEPKNFKLIGAGFDNIRGDKYAHIRFVKGPDHISLFICGKDVELPDFEKLSYLNSIDYWMHVCKHCQVLRWKCGHNTVIAVSDNPGIDMTSLIPIVKIS